MSMPIGLKRAAVLCILQSDAGFLLLHRSKEPHLGKYIPIGGKIEPFETPRNAAIREVKEETGILVENIHLRGIMTETSPVKFNWINYIYTVNVDATTPSDSSEGTLEWVRQERLDNIPTPTTDRFIYDYILRPDFFIFDAVYNENVELVTLIDELSGSTLFRLLGE
jgi:8-oxo-dGTP diphosphatase